MRNTVIAIGLVLILNGTAVLAAVVAMRRDKPAKSFADHVDDALDVVGEDAQECECPVCEDLTDDAVDAGWAEALDTLSRADFRRFRRLGALFPPVIPGRE